MINAEYIADWHNNAPWSKNDQVEQDLLICRCLVAIYNDEFLASQLAFRGGTALHKLFFHPQPRYSEDIDLVQIHPGPIKPILQRLGEVLSFMPDKVVKQRRHSNSFLFRVDSAYGSISNGSLSKASRLGRRNQLVILSGLPSATRRMTYE